jgi:lysophospholipase L1-like esterase
MSQSAPQHVATIPAHRLNEEWWKTRHEQRVALTAKGGIDVAFIGDSITHSWENGGKAVWAKNFAPLKSGNYGFSGDRTEHVLWRLQNGEVIGAQPKVVVIMIGTNNIGHGSSTPAQTADGVEAIVGKLLGEIPGTQILLLGVFPRGLTANDDMRKKAAASTAGFEHLGSHDQVTFLDIGKFFIRPSGTLKVTMMPDRLHLSGGGYEIWAKAILPTVTELLNQKS